MSNFGWGGRSKKKYNNQSIKADGFTFASEVEYHRYLILKDRQHDGEIMDLQIHPAFILEVAGVKIFERPYHPDFKYRLVKCPSGNCLVDRDSFCRRQEPLDEGESSIRYWCSQCCVVEDAKGYMDSSDPATRMFKVQCKLMEAVYGIDVKIIQTILAKRRQDNRDKNKKENRRLQQLALIDEKNDRRRRDPR
jgi:hypothetical protein